MSGIGHNGGPTFDDIVRETLDRGLLICIKEVIVEAMRDPRLERRHLRVLAEIIDCINSNSGTAYPGRKAIAERTLMYVPEEYRGHYGYTEAGVGKTISELVRFGYLVSAKRAGQDGGRAVAHYTIRKPARDDLEKAITDFIISQRLRPDRRWAPRADVTFGGNVRADATPAGNVTHQGNVRPPVVTHVGNESGADVTQEGNVTCAGNVTSDVTYVPPTVTRHLELGEGENSAGASESHAGHGVYVNGDTIRHPAFVISLPGIRMNTIASGLTATELKDRCLGHALQWAAEIENGAPASKVIPGKIANFLSKSIMADQNNAAVADVRKQKARDGYGTRTVPDGKAPETQAQRIARLMAEDEAIKARGRA